MENTLLQWLENQLRIAKELFAPLNEIALLESILEWVKDHNYINASKSQIIPMTEYEIRGWWDDHGGDNFDMVEVFKSFQSRLLSPQENKEEKKIS